MKAGAEGMYDYMRAALELRALSGPECMSKLITNSVVYSWESLSWEFDVCAVHRGQDQDLF